ncbi:MAG: HAMP domain-containing histidine kinase [Propionibacteriaceae bacterium]|jgi:two-component system sensor histidine kinase MprB|nr:HAMP domain-containing histidine kinase [Propionibacteriaceae bacterium]
MQWMIAGLRSFAHQVRTSLRYRLVFLTALTLVLGALIIGVVTYQAARISLYSQLDLELLSIAERTATQLSVNTQESSPSYISTLETQNVVAILVKANKNIEILLGDREQPLIPSFAEIAVARLQSGSSARNGVSEADVTYRLVAVPFVDAASNEAYSLVIARALDPTTSALANLALLQALISLTSVSVSIVIAFLVAGATLNPIRDLTSVVSGITSADELTTIEVRGASEVADLKHSFNVMMESLAASRTQQNRLIADAGHELRTPLTSMRTNVELLIADDSAQMLPEEARTQILSDVAAQLSEFTSLVNDLVMLSRGAVEPTNFMEVDFSAVVDRAISRAQRRGPSMIFDVSMKPLYVMGDAATLERAITNLLDNAVKFSPQGGTITVRLDSEGLVITDEGPGIAEEDRDHIFERFYRSDLSRNTPGTGLGLSIVAHTVTAHGGTVEVDNAKTGGAQFTLRIPEVEPEDEMELAHID